MRKSIICFLLLAVAPLHLQGASAQPAQAVNGWGVPRTDVEADPAIRFGRLANGMKYAIRRNATPKGTASLRLHFAFGSIAESEQERGLAHFIEHMAFNGTTNVPEGEMIKILERQGLAFGPDTNAATGFDSTTYMLELPKTDAKRLDTAFFLMREVASEVRFDPQAVDRERGIIISERRTRDNYQLRRVVENLKFHLPMTPYATRLPIGTDAVINGASAETLADLYRRYYRPENATLVFVGDADPLLIERLIRAKFSSWKPAGSAGAKLNRGKIDLARPADAASFTDPAVETSVSLSVMRPWENPADTRWERRRRIVQSTAMALLTRRLQVIANSEDSKLISGAAALSPSKDVAWSSTVSASVKDGEWKAALQTLEQELRKALKYGFSASELKVQLLDTEGGLKRAADRASTRSNQDLAGAILAVIDDNDVITRPEYRFDFFKAVKPTLTVDEINAEFRRMWAGSRPLVFVTDKKPVDGAEIAAAMESSRQVAVAPRTDNGDLKFAYENFGSPGEIVADKRIADLGIRTVRFANNVRLNIKKTDFEKGSVRYSVRVAGGEIALPDDKPGLAAMVGSISAIAALEKHSMEDLKLILAGRSVQTGMSVGADAFVAGGTVATVDLPLQMKLSAAFVTAPGYRREAATRWAALLPVIEGQRRSTPQAVATYEVPQILANGDPRFGPPETPVLARRSLDELRTALQPILADAPIEIGIVGDVDEEVAIAALALSFGALPPRRAEAPSYAEARKASFRKDLSPVALTHAGQADQALLTIAWPTDDDDNAREVIGLNLLASVLRLELTEELRERLGTTYSAATGSSMSDVYDGFGQFTATTVVAPEKLDEAETTIAEVVARLRERPIGADLLARALNPNLERVDRQQRENGYWLSLVGEAQSDGERLERHRKRKAIYRSLTPVELQQLAQKYLRPESQLSVRIVSDKLQKTVASR